MINEDENNIATDSPAPAPIIPAPTLSKRLISKKFIFAGVLLLFVILTVGGAGFYYISNQNRAIRNEPISQTGAIESTISKMVSTEPTISPEITINTTKEVASAKYTKREKVYETVKLQADSDIDATTEGDWFLDIYDFYKIGTITSGKYKDGDLLLVILKAGGPCKGPSCGKSIHLRYVKNGNVVTLLTNISHPNILNFKSNITKINPFKKFGLSLAVDYSLTIPILEYPKEIQGANKRQVLKAPEYLMEEDGESDQTKLYKVFTHPLLGNIFTTKVEFSPSRSFGTTGQGHGGGADGCRDTDCFTTNQFFAFRPDGTYLKFNYNPDVSEKDITWSDNKKTGEKYESNTVAGCNRTELDDNSVVAPSYVNDTDLVSVGKANNTGDTIYGLIDQNHKLYTEFYNSYKEYFAGSFVYPEEKKQIISFTDFINSRSVFLWRDPFGRLIRFNNGEFLPPYACEPIIYLYPQSTEKVSITFDKIVNISDSTPEYRNGWNVIADPTGKIFNPSDNRTYPYLFWEGWSLIFPIQDKGFVVKQSNVAHFLTETLPKLGLNEKEKADFLEAWLPEFHDSPYYFITFLDQIAIDKIAPLQISPKPDTVIRVLMDSKPLEQSINVVEPEFKKVPQRSGFTVVEWGGLKR